ncbi:MAG: hypothetical protein A3A98_03810 [Candidatus Staskawiczbacteria bacterium RIFCSPLOWO2_01_FULL_40_39]|uniref:Methyltransferase domain-containing protein n=1 Tax=Candidatus Staskawiczbacteria bacterium RIFCSPHIGHO2_01_FULL_39_25 TaxID=1802202 RepID=A0A1G2HNN8_9BACT|nr:MAG: hypothetical protein A2730_03025 [Candidatus Staskawiczbacteria bacterium RIFCSPHIGHO2_01_FULL_39_25]OGZ73536.1 MAG: hypothetical protein A3A98_03810 [Candidatus Staskawiczbacteria bacterium RIFCSPLOWO2_01_FULL_40_39]OGZ75423.1 MAG: hypothetical protein A3I87_03210 [Candidatus Staskawiczbacteria bacterium RIFCSPLOWO2_02_FULL_39_8]
MDFLKVDEVLANLDLKDTMLACEFGCGSAVFTLSLAKKLNKGKVYALDIQEEKLSALQGKAKQEHVSNIQTILCDLEAAKGSTFPDNALDLVLIPNVLFQAENKYAMINEGKRILKPQGQLLIVDWLKRSPFSPKNGMVAPAEVKKIADELGLSLKKEFAAGDYHYALLFIK